MHMIRMIPACRGLASRTAERRSVAVGAGSPPRGQWHLGSRRLFLCLRSGRAGPPFSACEMIAAPPTHFGTGGLRAQEGLRGRRMEANGPFCFLSGMSLTLGPGPFCLGSRISRLVGLEMGCRCPRALWTRVLEHTSRPSGSTRGLAVPTHCLAVWFSPESVTSLGRLPGTPSPSLSLRLLMGFNFPMKLPAFAGWCVHP